MNQFNDKEFQIIKLLTKGLNNTEISKKMFISVHTVKIYVSTILHKLNAKIEQKQHSLQEKIIWLISL